MVVVPRDDRLKKLLDKRQFTLVMARPAAAQSSHFAVHVLRTTPVAFAQPQGLWAGVVLPKRWAKRAVTRNGIRRQIYALAAQSLQENQPALADQGLAMVVRLRRAFDTQLFVSAWSDVLRRAVRAELEPLITRAVQARSQ